jgi:hypothetical protein
MNHISILNLTLCTIILALGVMGYSRKKNILPLFIGIAFGLFGISHLLTIIGLKETLETFLIVIRTIAYLTVVYTVFQIVFKTRNMSNL